MLTNFTVTWLLYRKLGKIPLCYIFSFSINLKLFQNKNLLSKWNNFRKTEAFHYFNPSLYLSASPKWALLGSCHLLLTPSNWNGLAPPKYKLGGQSGGILTVLERSVSGVMERGTACFVGFIVFFFREENLHFINKSTLTGGGIKHPLACLYFLQSQKIRN